MRSDIKYQGRVDIFIAGPSETDNNHSTSESMQPDQVEIATVAAANLAKAARPASANSSTVPDLRDIVEEPEFSIRGPLVGIASEAERILRTLPLWFGQEASLMEYASMTSTLPTFVVEQAGQIVGFMSLQRHFRNAWEINCIAIDITHRNRGLGRALHERAVSWLESEGCTTLQVKTLADTHPSNEYAQTRVFYENLGYLPLEVFTTLWGPGLPVLQLTKHIGVGVTRAQLGSVAEH